MRVIPDSDGYRPTFSVRWLASEGEQTFSGSDFVADVETQKSALSDIGLRPKDKVGLRGDNSYLWMVTDVALAELDIVSVVFPNEFQDQEVETLIDQYGLHFFILAESEVSVPESAHVARLGRLKPGHHSKRTVEDDPYPVTEDDHSFVFSSGTSGSFKGMVISKKGVKDQIETFADALGVTQDDRVLMFMPFSSLQNRVLYYGAIARNVEMTAVSPPQLLEGLKRFKPTLLIAPPIFYEAVEKNVRAALKRQNVAVKIVMRVTQRLATALRPFSNGRMSEGLLRAVFGAAHTVFGGRIRVLVTGMAKIGSSTLQFYQSLGLPLIQVYGLTECGVVCANTPQDNEIGTVGKPLPGNKITIAEDGEIVVEKVAPQTSRFFHFESSTEDTRFENGRIYTGDLGQISDRGTLTLIGRKKSTIVGHTGIKVQPEPIEKALEEFADVSKAVLIGLDGGRRLGIVLQTTRPLSQSERSALQTTASIQAEDMAPSFKKHFRVTFTETEFTADNGLLTRNLKINRSAVQQQFFPVASAATD